MSFSPHVASVGEQIIGHAGPAVDACGPGGVAAISWVWSVYPGLTAVRPCAPKAAECVFNATAPTGMYVQGCIDGSSGFGGWISCDYYGVVGKDCFELSGRAIDRGRGIGIPDARIFAGIVGAGRATASTLTDATGHYTLPLCKKGPYFVLVDHANVRRRLSEFFYDFAPAFVQVDLDGDRTINFFATVDTVVFSETPVSTTPPSWSSPAGQQILKTWGLTEGAASISTKAILDASKAVKDGGGLVTGPVKAITGKLNPYFTAVSTGLAIGAFLDTVYAWNADPFDPNFTAVAVPEQRPAPSVSVGDPEAKRELNAFIGNYMRMDEITTALLTTENRASSATQAGNAPAHQLQVRAASQYLNDLAALTDANVSLQVKIATLLRRALHAAGVRRVSLSEAAIRAAQQRTGRDGLTGAELRLFSSLGASLAYASDWAGQQAHARVPSTLDLPGLLSSPAAIRDGRNAAATLRADSGRVQ